ncbi:MAG: alpha-amylase family protein [Deltaproteobacteria bacterium]|nr:alpha-amylase family protein [Deltaproteobacteria bacterium]
MLTFNRRNLLGATQLGVFSSLAQNVSPVSAAIGMRKPAQASGLPFRQVHLDFHTSEWIDDVGVDFDAAAFAQTLKTAKVNAINVFAKCHHGFAYYETALGHRHPSLRFDLFGQMVQALRSAGIEVSYYYSLVWDVRVARLHPNWRQRDSSGIAVGGDDESQAWPALCMNSPYLSDVISENREIIEKYDVNGAWFDILKTPEGGCHCTYCLADRKKLGVPETKVGHTQHNKLVAIRVEKSLFELVRSRRAGARVFFNSRLVVGVRDEMPNYTHVEIESLPTGGWGYTHFQHRVRYLRNLGRESVGMTGRFHKSWGDFGGLKNQAALDFECLSFLANGCRACIGDQLHPRGVLDRETYRRIGATYSRIEALEPWAVGAVPVVDIGVLSTAAFDAEVATQKVPPVDQGFTNMLVELHQQFDVLDLDSDFNRYAVLILPDQIPPVPRLIAKLKAYLNRGGRLLSSHRSLVDLKSKQFSLPDFGVTYEGDAKFSEGYLVVENENFAGIPGGAYFLYQQPTVVSANAHTRVLAKLGNPYFDRTSKHYTSHKQSPIRNTTNIPIVVANKNTAYIGYPIFTSYGQDAYGISKQVVAGLLKRLLPTPVVRAQNLPSTATVSVLTQDTGSRKRTIVHVLHYPLTRRAEKLDIIEEPGVLVDVQLDVRCPDKPRSVVSIPDNKPIDFEVNNGYVRVTLSKVVGHAAFAIV